MLKAAECGETPNINHASKPNVRQGAQGSCYSSTERLGKKIPSLTVN